MLKQPLVSRGKDFVWNELSDYVKNELGDKHFSTDFLRKLSTFCWSRKSLPFLSLAIEKSLKSQNLKLNILYEPHITKVLNYHTNALVLPVQPSLY